ncbi:MAG: hypothetical protein ACREYC_06420 [Gammaproteobacteria bacterium]
MTPQRRRSRIETTLAVALAVLATSAEAQQRGAAAQPPAAAAEVEAGAIAALEKMGAYLRDGHSQWLRVSAVRQHVVPTADIGLVDDLHRSEPTAVVDRSQRIQ